MDLGTKKKQTSENYIKEFRRKTRRVFRAENPDCDGGHAGRDVGIRNLSQVFNCGCTVLKMEQRVSRSW
jgi:hypothetical protein